MHSRGARGQRAFYGPCSCVRSARQLPPAPRCTLRHPSRRCSSQPCRSSQWGTACCGPSSSPSSSYPVSSPWSMSGHGRKMAGCAGCEPPWRSPLGSWGCISPIRVRLWVRWSTPASSWGSRSGCNAVRGRRQDPRPPRRGPGGRLPVVVVAALTRPGMIASSPLGPDISWASAAKDAASGAPMEAASAWLAMVFVVIGITQPRGSWPRLAWAWIALAGATAVYVLNVAVDSHAPAPADCGPGSTTRLGLRS